MDAKIGATALSMASWMPAGVLSAAIGSSMIQSRGAPTPGQPVTGGTWMVPIAEPNLNSLAFRRATFTRGGATGACGQPLQGDQLFAALGEWYFLQASGSNIEWLSTLCEASGSFSNSVCGKQVQITSTQNKTVTVTITESVPVV